MSPSSQGVVVTRSGRSSASGKLSFCVSLALDRAEGRRRGLESLALSSRLSDFGQRLKGGLSDVVCSPL